MARGVSYSGLTKSSPPFLQDWVDRRTILPVGVKIDAAQFTADADGYKHIPAGTLLGRTLAEKDADTPFGPYDTLTDDAAGAEVFLTAYDVTDALDLAEAEVIRHGAMILENFLPGWATLPAATKARIRALYTASRGVE